MTLTLVARNPYTRQVAVAIASGADDCVSGSLYMRDGVGIVSVQGKGDRKTGHAALEMMADGYDAADILARLRAADTQVEMRQILLMPFDGPPAVFTGGQCLRWAGHLMEDNHIVAGNMLASARVVPEMEKAFLADRHALLRHRLFYALRAGMAAGGDVRGHQSAGIFIIGHPSYSLHIAGSAAVLDDLSSGVQARA